MKDPVKKLTAFITSVAVAATMSVAASSSAVAECGMETGNVSEFDVEPAISRGVFDEWLADMEAAYVTDLVWNDLIIVSDSTPDMKCSFTVDEDAAEINVLISNTFEEDKTAVIVLAQYNGMGKLINTVYKEITVPGKTAVPMQYTVKADCIPEGGSSIMGFVWSDFESMRPIAKLTE